MSGSNERRLGIVPFPLGQRLNAVGVERDLGDLGIDRAEVSATAARTTVELLQRLGHYGVSPTAQLYLEDCLGESIRHTAIIASDRVSFAEEAATYDLSETGVFYRYSLEKPSADAVSSLRALVRLPTATIRARYEALQGHPAMKEARPGHVARLALSWAFFIALSELTVDFAEIHAPAMARLGFDDWIGRMSAIMGNPMNPFENPTRDSELKYIYGREINRHRLAFGMTIDLLKHTAMRASERQSVAACLDDIVSQSQAQMRQLHSAPEGVSTFLMALATPAELGLLRQFAGAILPPAGV